MFVRKNVSWMQQEQIYNIATDLAKSKRAIDIKRALDLFESIPEYKDASGCARACKERLDKLDREDLHPPVTAKKRLAPLLILFACLLLVCLIGGIVVSSLVGEEGNGIHTPFPTLFVTFSPTPTETVTPTREPTVQPTEAGTPTIVPSVFPTRTPAKTPEKTPTPTPTLTLSPLTDGTVQVGGTVYFGSYEQDNHLENGKELIEWIVLDKQGDKAFLLSRYALDTQPYNTTKTDVTWETCTLRTWLNTTFYQAAFTESQQQSILTTLVENPDNPRNGRDGGNDTMDKVFLLSIPETATYFPTEESLLVVSTDYTKGKNAYVNPKGNSAWWLRHIGASGTFACMVSSVGMVNPLGLPVEEPEDTVRPAMWITLS